MQDAKNRHLGSIAQLCRAIGFATKARIDKRKKNLLNSNTSPTYPHGELRPTIRLRSVGEFGTPQQISTAFVSWQRYCTALY